MSPVKFENGELYLDGVGTFFIEIFVRRVLISSESVSVSFVGSVCCIASS